jgi:hypothetical protein
MTRYAIVLLSVVLAAGVACPAAAAGPGVGHVKLAEGTALVVRSGQALAAHAGQPLLEGDLLRTGPDGRLGVILADDTRISLGHNSELQIDRVVFEPAQGRLALVLRWARGVAAFVSGEIARLAPGAVRIETPVAIVGIRGTHFAGSLAEP